MPDAKRQKPSLDLQQFLSSYRGQLKNFGVSLLQPDEYKCPSTTCGKPIIIDAAFCTSYPHSFRAIGLLHHLLTDCLDGNKVWVYSVLAGTTIDWRGIYVGKSLYVAKKDGRLTRFTQHQGGPKEGGSSIIEAWKGLFGVPFGITALTIREASSFLLDLRPDSNDGSEERYQFERLWSLGPIPWSHRIDHLRGSVYSGEKLKPFELAHLEKIRRDRNDLCFRCDKPMHRGGEICPNAAIGSAGPSYISIFEDPNRPYQDAQHALEEEEDDEAWSSDEESNGIEHFRPEVETEVEMFKKLYSLVPRDKILAIGYVQPSDDRERWVTLPSKLTPQSFRIALHHPGVADFQKAVMSALEDESPSFDTIGLVVPTGVGKSVGQRLIAIEAASESFGATLILAPQRNVVEDMARGFAKMTTKNAKKIPVEDLRSWDKGFQTPNDQLDILLGGDIAVYDEAGNELETVRWMMYLGSDGMPALGELCRDEDWIKEVDILVATIDKAYINSIPQTVLKRLRLVMVDEMDMPRDYFGGNFMHHLAQLQALTASPDVPLVFGLVTATCGEAKIRIQTLTGRQESRINVIGDLVTAQYVSLFQALPPRNPLQQHWEGEDSPPISSTLFDEQSLCQHFPNNRGNLHIWYTQDQDAFNHRDFLSILLDRRLMVPQAAAISFHDRKQNIYEIEAILRSRPGQEQMFFSYTGDHPPSNRVLRGAAAKRKTMIATSAAMVGQDISQTQVVLKGFVHDLHALKQSVGRAGRDCIAVSFIACGDPKNDDVARQVAENCSVVWNGKGAPLRIPKDSPALFFKNVCLFLDRLDEDNKERWSELVRDFYHIPPALSQRFDDVSGWVAFRAREHFFQNFMNATLLTERAAEIALALPRSIEQQIPIVRNSDGKVLAKVSKLRAFKDFFPGSINTSIHRPNKEQWKFVAVKVAAEQGLREPDNLALPVLTIHNVVRIIVEIIRVDGQKLITEGVLGKDVVSSGIQLEERDIEIVSGHLSTMTIKACIAERTISRSHDGFYVRDLDREHWGDRQHPKKIQYAGFDVRIWGRGSTLLQKCFGWSLIISVNAERRQELSHLKKLHMEVSKFIQAYFGVTDDCFAVDIQVKRIKSVMSAYIEVVETAQGTKCGLCTQMMERDFIDKALQSLFPRVG